MTSLMPTEISHTLQNDTRNAKNLKKLQKLKISCQIKQNVTKMQKKLQNNPKLLQKCNNYINGKKTLLFLHSQSLSKRRGRKRKSGRRRRIKKKRKMRRKRRIHTRKDDQAGRKG